MKVTGKIKFIGETQTFGSNGFKKRELVITTEEQYPQHILIEFVQDKTDLLNKLKIGQNIEISYNLRGREWVSPQGETKYFNTIQGWKIEATDVVTNNIEPAFEPVENLNTEENNDLPF